MVNQSTKRLTGIVALAGFGLMAILPASQVSCTPNTRAQVTESYEGESRAYNALQSIANENPQTFEKSFGGADVVYHDSSLKISRGLIVPGLPESGNGRYIITNADGKVNFGFIGGDKSVSLDYNKATGELVIGYDVNKFVRYSNINGICRKAVYSGNIEGMKTDGIPFKDTGKADKNEVKRWLKLMGDIAGKFPANISP